MQRVIGLLLLSGLAYASPQFPNYQGISPDNTKVLDLVVTESGELNQVFMGFSFDLNDDTSLGAFLVDTAGAYPLLDFPVGVNASQPEYVTQVTNPDPYFFVDLRANHAALRLDTSSGSLLIPLEQQTPEPALCGLVGIILVAIGIFKKRSPVI